MRLVRQASLVIALCCAGVTARADDFQRLRLEARDDRHAAGVWLFAWGAANTLGGGLVAGLGHDDEAWLAAGVTAASFGVVNALLSFGLLDLSGAKRRAILEVRETDPRALTKLREEQIVAELQSGQFYAVNFGLDIAYLTAGVLLYVLGQESASQPAWARGAGLTIIGQGAFLLVFDLVSWIGANERAARYREL
jgi:hypothetical protein